MPANSAFEKLKVVPASDADAVKPTTHTISNIRFIIYSPYLLLFLWQKTPDSLLGYG
jgi:hypothetical protein